MWFSYTRRRRPLFYKQWVAENWLHKLFTQKIDIETEPLYFSEYSDALAFVISVRIEGLAIEFEHMREAVIR